MYRRLESTLVSKITISNPLLDTMSLAMKKSTVLGRAQRPAFARSAIRVRAADSKVRYRLNKNE